MFCFRKVGDTHFLSLLLQSGTAVQLDAGEGQNESKKVMKLMSVSFLTAAREILKELMKFKPVYVCYNSWVIHSRRVNIFSKPQMTRHI